MSKHECTKEAVFTKIFTILERLINKTDSIKRSLDGNGSPGLIKKSQEANEYIIQQKAKAELSRKSVVVIYAIITMLAMIVGPIIAHYIIKRLGG